MNSDANSKSSIRLANPRGFCAGVDRAIDIVNRALDIFGEPVYVRHEVVHNKYVVETLRKRGAVFVDELEDVPLIDKTGRQSIVVFSAHGVAQAVKDEASTKGFKVFDATCPLVTKVHLEVLKLVTRAASAFLSVIKIIQKLMALWGSTIDPKVVKYTL